VVGATTGSGSTRQKSDGGDRGDAPTAPACDQPRRERQAEHGADSHGRQHEPEPTVAEPVFGLEGGNACDRLANTAPSTKKTADTARRA
jgi:hypothetical protein